MTQPLGKNDGGYFGETIRISDVLERTLASAEQNGWGVELFPGAGELPLYGMRRLAKREQLSVYISTGIHGDEPGGLFHSLWAFSCELVEAVDRHLLDTGFLIDFLPRHGGQNALHTALVARVAVAKSWLHHRAIRIEQKIIEPPRITTDALNR